MQIVLYFLPMVYYPNEEIVKEARSVILTPFNPLIYNDITIGQEHNFKPASQLIETVFASILRKNDVNVC